MSSRFGGGAKCALCNKTVYMAEEVVAEGQKWHKLCFKCNSCGKSLDTTTLKTHSGSLYCNACHKKKFDNKGHGPSQAPQSSGGKSYGGADGCPRCGGRVYAAEKIVGAGSSWHKACFNCIECNKKLDSTTVSDNEGQIYCKGCYGKNFGPKGFGFGQGAGALTRTA